MGRYCETPKDPELGDIAVCLRRIGAWSTGQKDALVANTRDIAERIGVELVELKRFSDPEFELGIGHDRRFWEDLHLSYANASDYFPDLRAAIALFYHDQLSGN